MWRRLCDVALVALGVMLAVALRPIFGTIVGAVLAAVCVAALAWPGEDH